MSCRKDDNAKRLDRYNMMTGFPVHQLILKLAVPTIISMMVTALYNLVDAYFVGNISTGATAGVGVAFAFQTFIQAIGFFFGAGSGNFISRALGARHDEDAGRMAATGFFSSMVIGVIIAVLGLLFLSPLSILLGATTEVIPYSNSYLRFLLIATPFMISQMVLNNQLRLQGNAKQAMIGLTAGAVINMILDPILIFSLNLGVAGASIATCISQIISWIILLLVTTKKGNVHIRFSNFSPTVARLKEILYGGLPSLSRQTLGSISAVMLNWAAAAYALPGHEASTIAAFAIVSRVMLFAMSLILGFGQGFQPVCGFNWGAGLYNRVRQSYIFTIQASTFALIIMSTLGFIFAKEIVTFFRNEDPELIAIGTRVLRWQCLGFPLVGLTTPTNMLLQNIRRTVSATLLAMSRQGIFFLPAIIIAPRIWGLAGLEATMTIADACTFLLALPMAINIIKEMSWRNKNKMGTNSDYKNLH